MIASVSVGTTSVEVLPAPAASPYKFVAIGNVGGNVAYLKMVSGTTEVTVQNGIPLPAGAAIVCDQDKERELFDSGVTAIAGASGTTTLSVQAF